CPSIARPSTVCRTRWGPIMPKTRRLLPVLFSVLLLGAAAPAVGQEVQRVGDFQAWSAYVAQEGEGKVCFVASKPLKSEGNYTRRGTVVAMVTRRPGRVPNDEV